MGVTKTTTQEGTGVKPVEGQTVTIEYTGWLKDPSKPDGKGKQYGPYLFDVSTWFSSFMTNRPPPHRFDSSVGRGDFVTSIGVGKVIKGECALLPANFYPLLREHRFFLTRIRLG